MTTVDVDGRVESSGTPRADFMAESEVEAVDALRSRGFAVILFNAFDLEGASADLVEARLIDLGWDVIQRLSQGDASGTAAANEREECS